MSEIKDLGKVWFPGTFSPVFALRIQDTVFAPGVEEGDDYYYWIDQKFFMIDIHNKNKSQRIARRFRMDLIPTTPAALFNGFENTIHGDIKVVTHQDPGVDEFIVKGETYDNSGIKLMDREKFWRLAGY